MGIELAHWAHWIAPIRQAHMLLVGISVGLFAARGAAVLAGRNWPMIAGVRYASVAIDTLLLGAGVSLAALLGLSPLRHAWLASKLTLLVVYIVLGSLALKRARTRGARAVTYLAALAVAGTMVTVALRHHPLGWLAPAAG